MRSAALDWISIMNARQYTHENKEARVDDDNVQEKQHSLRFVLFFIIKEML